MSSSSAARVVGGFGGVFMVAALAPLARGTELAIAVERVAGDEGRPPTIELALSWKNAWRNERNHDAAWVVLRDRRSLEPGPLRLAAEGHRSLEGDPAARIVPSEDGLGAFVA